jgi:hypothetical protein
MPSMREGNDVTISSRYGHDGTGKVSGWAETAGTHFWSCGSRAVRRRINGL